MLFFCRLTWPNNNTNPPYVNTIPTCDDENASPLSSTSSTAQIANTSSNMIVANATKPYVKTLPTTTGLNKVFKISLVGGDGGITFSSNSDGYYIYKLEHTQIENEKFFIHCSFF